MSAAPRRRRFHRGRLAAALVLGLSGLAVCGYLGWQYLGSNLLAEHRRGQVVEELVGAWAEGADAATTRFGTADAVIEIPRFGADYEVPVLEGTTNDVLAVGFGHFRGAAGPGQVGNYALAAHRVTHGEPLRDMPDLRIGDVVRVRTRTHTYVYRLTTGGDDLIVPMTATWVTTPLPRNPRGGVEPPQDPAGRLLTLTTCAELFHTDDREIAFGVLVRAIPVDGRRVP